jgi:hypothetical protein
MAQSGGIRAGAAFIELYANDVRLVKGLQGASRRLKAFGAGLEAVGLRMMALGAGIVAPLLASAKGYADMGDQLDKMSKRTGFSVETLSELGYAAQLAGTDLAEVEVAAKRMQRVIVSAADGSKAAADALAMLGFDAEQLQLLKPEDQFLAIAKRLSEIADPTQRAAAAMEVFGRSGTSILPMLENLGQARAEARRLGVVMSTEDAKAAAEMHDAFTRVMAVLRSLVVTVGSALAPILMEAADKVMQLILAFRDWLSQNKGLVVSILKIGPVVLGVGAGLTALGPIVSALGTAFGIMASVISTALGFILTPVGLVVTALAGLAGYIVWATGAGGKALEWLGARFDDLKSFALDSLQGIKDALAAGDIALAARILWLSMKVVWQAGINWLKGYWYAFKYWFLQTTSDIFDGMTIVVAEAWYGLRRIWTGTINFLLNLWTRFSTGVLKIWNRVQGFMAKQWAKVLGTLDSSIDVEAVSRNIDRQTEAMNKSADIRSETTRAERDKELAAIEVERKEVINSILDETDAKDKARKESQDKDLADSEAALKAAKDEWAAALAEAKAKRLAAEQKKPEPPPEAPTIPPREKFQDEILPAVERIAKIEVVGTFSAEAARGLAVGPTLVEERTAKATEETAKNTKKIVDRMADEEQKFE